MQKLNRKTKEVIGLNLIAFMGGIEELSEESASFISNWILTGPEGKSKSDNDIWDFILSNYMPTTHPVLYRSCERIKDGKIASFTGSIRCANKISGNKGYLLICNTSEPLQFPEHQKRGEYEHTFFPISELLRKEAQSPNCKISRRLIEDFLKEDEYIMRVDINWMYYCKWC